MKIWKTPRISHTCTLPKIEAPFGSLFTRCAPFSGSVKRSRRDDNVPRASKDSGPASRSVLSANAADRSTSRLSGPVAISSQGPVFDNYRARRLQITIPSLPLVFSIHSEDAPLSTEQSGSKNEAWETFKAETVNLLDTHAEDLTRAEKKFSKQLLELLLIRNDEVFKGKLHALLLRRHIGSQLKNAGYNIQEAIKRVADMQYPAEWYTEARARQRQIHLHIGPTNSGKTYNALKRLEEADSGYYAGPLRLLAHEVYSRFQAKGIACNLITGDDVRIGDDTEADVKYAATVEMVDTSTPVDVAVIDEIQMMADPQRGWAWTRAFLGAVAKEVHLCGEARVLPLVRELAATMGDKLTVHPYERLNPLKVMDKSLEDDLSKLVKGDAVVCFTIVGIHAMKKAIERRTGKRVAIVYGSLPPETRAQQAALFNEPDNDYDFLVASDAIGMGLNLSIKRVIFNTVTKFDGTAIKQLSIPQIKQIAGRAGRYRTAREDTPGNQSRFESSKKRESVGWVTTMQAVDLPIVRAALKAEAPPITTAGILPPGDFIEDLSVRLPADTPHQYVLQTLAEAAAVHPRFSMCHLTDPMKLANIIEPVRGLDARTRHILTMAPFSFKADHFERGSRLLAEIAQRIADRAPTTVVDLNEMPLHILEQPMQEARTYLSDLEFLHASLILYIWLSYRMSQVLVAQDMAVYAKEMCQERINTYLETYTSGPESDETPHRLRSPYASRSVKLSLDGGEFEEPDDVQLLTEAEIPSGEEFGSDSSETALPIDWHKPKAESHSSDPKSVYEGSSEQPTAVGR